MIKKLTKTNICLLIIALCAVLLCGLFAINNFSAKKVPTAHAEGSSATIIGFKSCYDDNYAHVAGGSVDNDASLSLRLYRNNNRDKIVNLTITNKNQPTNYVDEPIDVSYWLDNSIHAYLIDNGNDTYDCVIYADVETIYAPPCAKNMFLNFALLETINFECFNTSLVTDMSGMFSLSSSLKQLDLSSFDTSRVEYINTMFQGCENLTSINFQNFNTSNVITMGGMFGYCSKLEQLDLSMFNTSSNTSMSEMFLKCSTLKNLNLRNFDIKNVTDMGGMFYGCSKLENVDISNFDTKNVTDISCMFYECTSLKNIDLSSFNTNNVTDMHNMFYNCMALTKIVGLDDFYTSKVTDMTGMFAGCTSLNVLDLSSFDFSSITSNENLFFMIGINDEFIFAYCSSLGDAGASLQSAYQSAVDNNSVEERIQVVAYAMQQLFGTNEDMALYDAEIAFSTDIHTIYAPVAVNSNMISLPFNNNAQYVYNDGTSEVETSFLVGRDTTEELAIYVKGETPLAKPETSAPSVTPETGFVEEQLLPAFAIGLVSIIAVVAIGKKKKFNI